MPTISTFYGISIYIYFDDAGKHHEPHIHVKYGEYTSVFSIITGEVLIGITTTKELQLVKEWIAIHKNELLENWELAISNGNVFKIEPLE